MKFPLAAVGMVFSLAACTQQQFSPQLELSPDGRTVAFLKDETRNGSRTVALLDRSTGTFSSFPLPDRKLVDQLMWLDTRLYAGSQFLSNPGYQLLDPLRNTWSPAPMLNTIWYQPFIGTYNGQPALYLPEHATEIRSLADLSVIGKLDYPVRGVGDGYMLRYHWPAGTPLQLTSFGWWRETGNTTDGTTYSGVNIDSLELLDPQFHVVMTLTAAQAAAMKIPFTDGEAQISPDHQSLLLAPRSHGPSAGSGWRSMFPRGFAALDIAGGKLLYTNHIAASTPPAPQSPVLYTHLESPLAFTNDGVYTLQEIDQASDHGTTPRAEDRQYWLVRFAADGFKRIIQIDLPPSQYYTTTSSPSGGFMLIHTLYPTPRILEVPLQPKVTAREIRQFPLSDKP